MTGSSKTLADLRKHAKEEMPLSKSLTKSNSWLCGFGEFPPTEVVPGH